MAAKSAGPNNKNKTKQTLSIFDGSSIWTGTQFRHLNFLVHCFWGLKKNS
jgi:hypothetical protein